MNYIYILFISLFIQGCGFKPMLKSEKGISTLDEKNIKLSIKGISGYEYFFFRKRIILNLKRRLEKMSKPTSVVINIVPSVLNVGIGRDATIIRKQIRYDTTYKIYHGKNLIEGHMSTITSFNQDPKSEFSNITSNDSAKERALSTLSERLSTAVSAHIYCKSNK